MAAATAPRVFVPSAVSGFRLRSKKPTRTAATAASANSAPRSLVRARAAVANDPLSDQERAELDLLDHADAIKQARRGNVHRSDVDEDGEPLTPEAIRIMQQKEEYWVGQENNYQSWYQPKKYGNVMSEFMGTVRSRRARAPSFKRGKCIHAPFSPLSNEQLPRSPDTREKTRGEQLLPPPACYARTKKELYRT